MTELAREIFAQILGEKKTEIILFLAQNADENGFICIKISQICEQTSASKPTVIETIKLLESRKIFERVKNGIYRFKNLKANLAFFARPYLLQANLARASKFT